MPLSSSCPAEQSWKVALQMKCKEVNQFISANIKIQHYYIGQIFPHLQQAIHSIFILEDLFPITEDKMKKCRSWYCTQLYADRLLCLHECPAKITPKKSDRKSKTSFNLFSAWAGMPGRRLSQKTSLQIPLDLQQNKTTPQNHSPSPLP